MQGEEANEILFLKMGACSTLKMPPLGTGTACYHGLPGWRLLLLGRSLRPEGAAQLACSLLAGAGVLPRGRPKGPDVTAFAHQARAK